VLTRWTGQLETKRQPKPVKKARWTIFQLRRAPRLPPDGRISELAHDIDMEKRIKGWTRVVGQSLAGVLGAFALLACESQATSDRQGTDAASFSVHSPLLLGDAGDDSGRANALQASPKSPLNIEGVPVAASCLDQACGTPCDPCGDVSGVCEAESVGFCNVEQMCVLLPLEVLECPGADACVLDESYLMDDGCNVCTCELVDGVAQFVCTEEVCLTPCTDNSDCTAGTYCAHDLGSCGTVGQSYCQEVPQECSGNGSKVCGCDAQIWDNPCAAAQEGVAVSAFGGCEATPTRFTCGDTTCANDEVCTITTNEVLDDPFAPAYVATCEPLAPECRTPSCDCVTLVGDSRCEMIGDHVFVVDLEIG
jgi:hypothetical protein